MPNTYDPTKLIALAALKSLAQKTKTVTDGLATRIGTLESVGAEANVLEGVKVNGTALAIASKMVDILITTGSLNGSISVNGTDVSVAGLAAMAYKSEVSAAELSTALAATINGKAAAADVATLIGTDTNKSVRTISAEEVAKVVASAPDDFDTLKEIADWIQSDTTGAAKMQSDISALKSKLTLGTHEVGGEQVEYSTVRAYVEAVTGSFIALTALSATDSGTGNVVTGVSYNSTTGVFTITKGTMVTPCVPTAAGNFATLTAGGQLADSGLTVATSTEVTDMLTEVFEPTT